MNNEELYQIALNAISALFSDMSVSKAKAKENLESLRDEIDIFMDSLGDD